MNRVRQLVMSPWLMRWKMRSIVGRWERLDGTEDAGETCIVDES